MRSRFCSAPLSDDILKGAWAEVGQRFSILRMILDLRPRGPCEQPLMAKLSLF